jgi:excisionase family DNA binding protein
MVSKEDRALLLTVSEAAQLLATGKNTVYAMIRSGRLPCLCLGETRGYRIPRQAIEEWIEEAVRARGRE